MPSVNSLTQYRFEMSVEEVLADREVSYPLTRAMCAPIGDGAAAAIVCSERFLSGLPARIRNRAIEVKASVLRSGWYRKPDETSLARDAGDRAYELAGIGSTDVDVAEVHDATAFGEIYNCEMMRFCEIGEGGPFVEAGGTALDGRLPVNTSGGLISKGHPIAASGLSMTYGRDPAARRGRGASGSGCTDRGDREWRRYHGPRGGGLRGHDPFRSGSGDLNGRMRMSTRLCRDTALRSCW